MSFNSQDTWKVYLNNSGVHSNIWHHLQTKHKNQYQETVLNENPKDNNWKAGKNSDAISLPLTQESLHYHLVEWITATDQVHYYLYLCGAQIEVFVSKPHWATEHPSF